MPWTPDDVYKMTHPVPPALRKIKESEDREDAEKRVRKEKRKKKRGQRRSVLDCFKKFWERFLMLHASVPAPPPPPRSLRIEPSKPWPTRMKDAGLDKQQRSAEEDAEKQICALLEGAQKIGYQTFGCCMTAALFNENDFVQTTSPSQIIVRT